MGMQHFAADLRYALRTLARSPTTVLITVVSLGVGLGAVTTVFTVTDGVLHPAAPWLRDPDRLVALYTSDEEGDAFGSTSFADFEDLRAADALEGAAAATVRLLSLDQDGRTDQLLAEVVTGNYFDLTGIRPMLGRTFAPDESAVDADAAVGVIAYGLWKDRFASDPGIVGRSIRVNGRPLTVIGVAPPGVLSRRVAVPVRPDLWVPLGAPQVRRSPEAVRARTNRDYAVLARLREGADLPMLRAQLAVVGDRLARQDPPAWTDDRGQRRVFSAVTERASRMNPGARTALAGIAVFFFGATGLVLLIACANVTSLFLVRAIRRGREVALRLALGAKRFQIVRMLFAEGLLLGLAAALVGLGASEWAAGAMRSFSLPINVPIQLDLRPGGRGHLFVFAAALATSVVFSVIPALRVSTQALVPALREGRATRWRRRAGRLRPGSVLVTVQFAASLVLIVGAGLFLRSLRNATTLDLGLDPSGIAVTTKSVPDALPLADATPFLQDLRSRVAAAPGASGAALSSGLELTLLQMGGEVAIRSGAPDEPESGRSAFRNAVTPGYLELLHVPILRGRSLEERDGPAAAPVAVVDEAFARAFWPGEDALGRSFTLIARSPGAEPKPRVVEVVGIAADGRYIDVDDPPTPYVWTSLFQDPSRTVAVVLKGSSAEAMARELRARVELDPGELPVLPPTTYESQLSIQFIHLRIVSRVLGWGGAFGLFLALIGVYGLVSFTIAQRTREIAIRRAVGADRASVVGAMLRHGLWHAVAGLGAGLVLLIPAARLVRGVLVGVGPMDPIAFLAGAVLLLSTATLASLVPARRAARIDPMVSLRHE